MKGFCIQWGVVLGVWWASLIDALGNYAGQDHSSSWLPAINIIVAVLVLAIGAMKVHLVRLLA